MEENKKKIAMRLIWHNCKNYPPSEDYNPTLILTDGKEIFEMRWDKDKGYYANCSYLKPDAYKRWWWADLDQTVRGCPEFEKTERLEMII